MAQCGHLAAPGGRQGPTWAPTWRNESFGLKSIGPTGIVAQDQVEGGGGVLGPVGDAIA